jgi:Arc/MetJ-type ribon-helix-helix transcriptional regulator
MDKETKMGRPRVDTEAVNLRLPRDMIEAIDDLRRMQPDLPTRPEMIRRALAEWLEHAGHPNN